MKNSCILIFFLIFCSCSSKEKKIAVNDTVAVKNLTKLEQLMLLPTDSVIKHYDLSYDSIKEFPDLSDYVILSLDLSFNQIDTLITNRLPQKIEKLNLSNNACDSDFDIKLKAASSLKEIDISYNKIETIYVGEPLYRIIVSHNDIVLITLNHKNIQYLDISYNPHLSNYLDIVPSRIDTIVRAGISNNKPLHSRFRFYSTKEGYESVMKEEAQEPDVKSMTLINNIRDKHGKKRNRYYDQKKK